ncbi:VOC family protein [bacterium]|nr:VOC family protein [bacterium]
MTVQRIHHINFLVKDLLAGIKCYQQLLGLGEFIIDDLPGRGVKTARIALGEQWLVLVQPVDMNGIPGKHLREHGEGFFLISYHVDDLDSAVERVIDHDSSMTSDAARKGLENWQVWDINSADTFGVQIQLCEEK